MGLFIHTPLILAPLLLHPECTGDLLLQDNEIPNFCDSPVLLLRFQSSLRAKNPEDQKVIRAKGHLYSRILNIKLNNNNDNNSMRLKILF